MRFSGTKQVRFVKVILGSDESTNRWNFDGCHDFDVFLVYLLESGLLNPIIERYWVGI
jgi:hypothetical protein